MILPRISTPALFVATAALSAWLCATLPVFSQEAYYWTYAQHPDLSYFDHPPMVAWLIWLGTALFGDGAIGIRLGTWICGVGTAWLGLLLLRDFGVGDLAQRLWLLIGIGSPALIVARTLANPDPPLIFFFTATLFAMHRARSGAGRWWLLAGVAAGAALLSKYTASFLAISGVLLFVFDPEYRRQLRGPWPYLAVLAATIVFSPVIAWNIGNDFESFRFQTAGRFKEGHLQFIWFVELIGGQFGLINPLLAILLPAAVMRLWRQRTVDSNAILLLAFGLPLPLYMLPQSLWIQVKANWLTPAYVPLLLAVVVWWVRSDFSVHRPRLARFTIGAMIWLQLFVLTAPLLRLVPQTRGSSWEGWPEIAERAEVWEEQLDAEDGVEGNVFFFAADYRDASQLGRSLQMMWNDGDSRPAASAKHDCGEPTMAQNVISLGALQFDHWESPAAHVGQNAIFVLPRPDVRHRMVAAARRHFASVEKVETRAILRLGIHLVDVDFYVCRGYRGQIELHDEDTVR